MARTGRYIGTAIASVINLLNTERIVLGGGVMDAGELILDPIIQEARRRSFQPNFESTQIVAATLGPGPGALVIGAATGGQQDEGGGGGGDCFGGRRTQHRWLLSPGRPGMIA